MTAGFTVYNDWGTVQVDENWAAMSLRHKIGVSIQDAATGARLAYNGSITVPASSPMVFWKSDAPIFILQTANNGNGTWTFVFRSSSPTFATVYVFDTPEWAGQNYGVEVFNGNGVKVFGDQLSPLKIAAIVPVSSVPQVWDGLTAGNYAVAVSDPGFKFESYAAQIIMTAISSCGVKDRPNGVQCDWTTARTDIPFEVSTIAYLPKFFLIADVTGL